MKKSLCGTGRTVKAIPSIYLIFAWKTRTQTSRLPEDRFERFYLSLRRQRRPDESIQTNDYQTRQGRNTALNLILQNPKYKGKTSVIRNTNPKQWIRNRKIK